MNKKTTGNVLLGVLVLLLLIFIWFFSTQGAKCISNPVKYIEHKYNVSSSFIGHNLLFRGYENQNEPDIFKWREME